MTLTPQANPDSPSVFSGHEGMWLDLIGNPFFVNLDKLTPELRTRVRQLWSRCESAGAHPESVSVEFSNGDANELESMSELTMALTNLAIEHADPAKFLLIHACAVANEAGSAVGFIGQSGAGKTTAATALGKRFQYLTDETLALDLADSGVLEYAKPLSVVAGPGPKLQKSPDELGLQRVTEKATLGSLYFLNRVAGTSEVQVEVLGWQSVLEQLVPQVSYLERRATPLQDLFTVIRTYGGIPRVTYSEAAQLDAFVGAPTASMESNFPEPRQVELPDLIPGQVYMVPGGVGSLRPTDAVIVGDQLVLLVRGRVVVLEPLPTEIWLLALQPRRFDELLELLKAKFPTDGLAESELVAALDGILQQLHEVGAVIYGGPRPDDFEPGAQPVDLGSL